VLANHPSADHWSHRNAKGDDTGELRREVQQASRRGDLGHPNESATARKGASHDPTTLPCTLMMTTSQPNPGRT